MRQRYLVETLDKFVEKRTFSKFCSFLQEDLRLSKKDNIFYRNGVFVKASHTNDYLELFVGAKIAEELKSLLARIHKFLSA